mgnify:CR=1 FL=1
MDTTEIDLMIARIKSGGSKEKKVNGKSSKILAKVKAPKKWIEARNKFRSLAPQIMEMRKAYLHAAKRMEETHSKLWESARKQFNDDELFESPTGGVCYDKETGTLIAYEGECPIAQDQEPSEDEEDEDEGIED